MPLNPNIILQPQQANQNRFENKLANFVNRDDIAREKNQLFALRDQKIAAGDLTNKGLKDKQAEDEEDRLNKSMVTGALRLKPLLQQNPQAALTALYDRKSQIIARGGDPSDTNEAIAMLEAGDIDGLNQSLDSIIAFGQQTGILTAPKADSGFTLGPGQTRFDAAGNELATGANKPDDPSKDRELAIKEDANAIRREELGFRQSQAEKVSLSPTVQKILDTSQTKAFESGEQAREMELLARDLTKADISGGVASTTSEKFKQALGSQEEVTDLRRRFRGFRASQAVTNLPPGVASDKDIELALSGFPAENANNQTIQSFLIGQAKLARLIEGFNIVKSELISETGGTAGLLKEWRERLEDEEFQASLFANIGGISSVSDTSSTNNSFQSSTGIQFTVE